MMRLFAAALLGLIPAACQSNETGAPYNDPNVIWTLVELKGVPFSARGTIVFGEDGQISGQAPCNRFFFTNPVPYPQLETGAIASTKMACPDLEAEDAFFQGLGAMTRVEMREDKLVLANDDGDEMVFTASD